MVDDATSRGLAVFDKEETTWGVADTLRAWVEEYGIPRALSVDWKSVYKTAPTARQKQEGIVPISQFGRMCQKLGLELIGGHGTHQDRLIKRMRLKKINSYEAANAFLADGYLAQHNAKYAVAAREKADYHLRVPPRLDLDQVFCLEEERIVSPDWVVQYGQRWLQIERDGQKVRVERGATVMVREHRDGTLSLWLNRSPAAGHPWRKPLMEKPWRNSGVIA